MRMQLRSLAALMVIVFSSASMARAIDITFDLTSGVDGQSSFSKTVSGFTLTFFNPGQQNYFEGTGNGLNVGVWNATQMTSFQFKVTGGSLIFKDYVVGDGGDAQPFSLTGGTGTSNNNPLGNTGTFNFNGPYMMDPSQTITFSAPGTTGSQYSQIASMTFSTVPEPSTYALAAIATGVTAAMARRRRARKA